ncbi:MAG: hypothetical protein ACHP84_17670 [Caulobacterales bacterium]
MRERGLDRYEVRGLEADKPLIRRLARRLAKADAAAALLRAELSRAVGEGARSTGGILRALRASPAVGADLDLTREVAAERPLDL